MPSSPSKPDRAGWLRGVTYAHRGLHGAGLVENSYSAFKAAIEAGLGIECDVRESADGVAMVFHDRELDRLTESGGLVVDRTMRELEMLRFRDTRDAMMTLGELLVTIAGRVPLLVEIKTDRNRPVERLCRAVADAFGWYEGPVAAMSFDPRVSAWFARHSPETIRGLVVSEAIAGWLRRHLALWQARPDFLAYDVRDLPSRFAAAQRVKGLPVLTWTVSTPALLARGHEHADGWIAEGEGLT